MIPKSLIPFTHPDAEPSYNDFDNYRAWLAKVTGWQCITYLEDGAITVCARKLGKDALGRPKLYFVWRAFS